MATPLGRKRDILIFILPGMLLYTAIVFFPIFSTVFYSFMEWDFASADRHFTGFANFAAVFKHSIFAMVLAWGVRGEKTFRIIYFLPTILSPVVVAQLFRHFYHWEFVELNHFLRLIGLESWTRYWPASEITALPSVVAFFIIVEYVVVTLFLMRLLRFHDVTY